MTSATKWTHRDVLRLSHAKPDAQVANFMVGKEFDRQSAPAILSGFGVIQAAESVQDVLDALTDYKDLPWETIPTEFLKDARVWKKLFYNGQLNGQALVRSVTRLARIGAFKDMVFARDYANALTNEEMIEKTRVHPINYLNASVVYEEGQVDRNPKHMYWGGHRADIRNKDWETDGVIRDALSAGFHAAFKNVEPANKRTLIGVDVSPSMNSFAANGLDLSASQVSAAVGLTIAKTEPYYKVMGFTSSFADLGISAGDNIATAMRKTAGRHGWAGTDVSLPMRWARENKIDVDTFVVITDNETNSGGHPHQELKKYRQTTGINAKLVVLGVSATDFTVADPMDLGGQMDLVGFDSNAPKVLADFSAGRL